MAGLNQRILIIGAAPCCLVRQEKPLKLKFSHVDVLVKDLEQACAYYARVFGARISRTLDWQRDGLHVRYAIVRFGTERLMLVQPFAGNLKALMDSNGEGTIYRHCYSTPDIEAAYDELLAAGVQPEDENGTPCRATTSSPPAAHASSGYRNASGISPSSCLKRRSWRPSSRKHSPRTGKAPALSRFSCRIG